MTDAAPPTPHLPVLLDEILTALLPPGRRIERAIDGTLGAGGHSQALLAHGAQRVLSFDLDPQALALGRAALAEYGERSVIVHASYLHMRQHADALGWGEGVDAL
ncbi:MAG: 16S rRNA (cytosine(1402)-N(4))-methyltransferase, partial [Armatimonadetes bacterium]|nr:16S rRNA (cytosine(1402)-N(4))-methyltransferase [Anaerolineae bacterium]